MSKPIRIGTRDSQLAMWQAKTVQSLLHDLGYETSIIAVKSAGDLVQNKPIYEMGITGVFTRTLDIALLNEEVDIAVHSMKDVPTKLPEGICQAAVIKRGNVKDTLVFKKNEEFLSQKNAVIATGSLRRKAQWLNRYPTHTITALRGNVNTRLDKLEQSEWNGAIFAAAGLGRIGLTPENAVNLDWMVPAPAQGAVMIAALENNIAANEAVKQLNDETTATCTGLEREFLRILEGGCSAPIGALAFVKNEELHFHGIILSEDGSKKVEIKRSKKLGEHENLAKDCAAFVISKGGKLFSNRKPESPKEIKVISSKTLTPAQRSLLNAKIGVQNADFIKISPNRIKPSILKATHEAVIITSKNAVEAILSSIAPEELKFNNIYCVGRRTKRLVEQKIGPVTHSEKNAKALANYLASNFKGDQISYFCSDIRLDTIPQILSKHSIIVHEIFAYSTKLNAPKAVPSVEGIMFYSPSTVLSFLENNPASGIAFCIGETTANAARKHFKKVQVASIPTVESVIELVNLNYLKTS